MKTYNYFIINMSNEKISCNKHTENEASFYQINKRILQIKNLNSS